MGNRNNHRRHGRRKESEQVQNREPVILPECPMCSKPIREVHSAVASRETGDPCHFDCVVSKLSEEENLKPEERICYLGHGIFGVIVPRSSSGPVKFTIKKKIQYEPTDRKSDWRFKMSGTISSIVRQN